jgi:hypothetical protein
MSGATIPTLSSSDHCSGGIVNQDAEDSTNPLNTPFSEVSFSQLVSESAQSYLDFDISNETISITTQIPYTTPRIDTPMLDWLNLGHDQDFHQHGAAQSCDLVETEQDGSATERTLKLLSERIVDDTAEVNDLSLIVDWSSLITTTTKIKPSLAHNTYKITALFPNADGGSRRQQAVLEKVKVLLTSKHGTCLSDLLRQIDYSGGHQSLGLNDLIDPPKMKLVQSMYRTFLLSSLLMFFKEHSKTQQV